MPELAIQQLLRERGLAGLEGLAIKTRRHGIFENLVCFKYDQRLSPMMEKAVQEARGLILDESRDWAVTSMSFRKFFNAEEPLATEINWTTACIEEKLDGSLMALYWYDNAWQVQSSGTADAAGNVVQDIRSTNQDLTYRELFWKTWDQLGYVLPPSPDELGATYTFSFELMTPHNRVVVRHINSRLVLHGVRNLFTLQEEPSEHWAKKLHYEAVKTHALTREGLREAARAISPMDGEGFVVRDSHFQRVKIKSEGYVEVSLLRESWSERRALELIVLGEEAEFLAYFPEYETELHDVAARVRRVSDAIDTEYAEIKDIPEQKAFAAQATKGNHSAALFALRKGQAVDAYSWLVSLDEAQRLRALALAGEPFPASS